MRLLIEIEINDFLMLQSNGCSLQSISFYDNVVSESTLATKFCGDGHPHRLTSKTGTLIMKIQSNTGIPPKYEIKYRANMDWDQFKAFEDKKRAYPERFKKGNKKQKKIATKNGKVISTKNLGKVVVSKTSLAKKKLPAQLKSNRPPRNSWNQPPNKPVNASVLKIFSVTIKI